jgi:nicotinamide-nucleotide amidase
MTVAPSDTALADLAVSLSDRLLASSARLVTAESCTGGYIAQIATSIAGSSTWFECGYVTYSNAAKQRDLAVPSAVLAQFGAVSIETAATMATGAMRRARVTLALSVTGIAGPDGGSPDKPVGTVCFGWAHEDGRVTTDRRVFPGDRDAVRRKTVAHALTGALQFIT